MTGDALALVRGNGQNGSDGAAESEVKVLWREWRRLWKTAEKLSEDTPEEIVERQWEAVGQVQERLINLPHKDPDDWAYMLDASATHSSALYCGCDVFDRMERIIGARPVGVRKPFKGGGDRDH